MKLYGVVDWDEMAEEVDGEDASAEGAEHGIR